MPVKSDINFGPDGWLEEWERFFHRFDIPATRERQPADKIDGPLQVVLEPRQEIQAEMVNGRPVIPLSETIEFAREHYATFESALDMLDRMYDADETDTEYRTGPA
jgi:hypothetical protein